MHESCMLFIHDTIYVTYTHQKRPAKETCIHQKRPIRNDLNKTSIYIKKACMNVACMSKACLIAWHNMCDIYTSKETCKRDLYPSKETHTRMYSRKGMPYSCMQHSCMPFLFISRFYSDRCVWVSFDGYRSLLQVSFDVHRSHMHIRHARIHMCATTHSCECHALCLHGSRMHESWHTYAY